MRGHKVRIYPTASQEALLNKFIGHSRYVYNELLARTIKEYNDYEEGLTEDKPKVGQIALTNKIMEFKHDPDKEWLLEAPAVIYQQKARDLVVAYSNFFRRVKQGGTPGFPKFKRRGYNDNFRLSDITSYSIKDGKLRVAKLSTLIKVRWDKRGLPESPKSCTISRDPSGRWFASFVVEGYSRLVAGTGRIGIDMGVTALATSSDGTVIDNPKYYHMYLNKLKRLQNLYSRTQKGSNRRNRLRQRIARVHAKIKDCRHDFIHKLTSDIVSKNQVIGIETLDVRRMVENSEFKLSRYIMDSGWGIVFHQLMYKAMGAGASIVQVDTFYPSTQTCSECNHRLEGDDKLTLSDRTWTCPSCHTVLDRDINAATNILLEVLRLKDLGSSEYHRISG